VNAVLSDENGRLWMPTDRGISRFDPADGSLRNYDRDDGALGRGYYFSAAATLGNGWLAFGSKDGFTVFDPLAALPARPVPAPRLIGIERDGAQLRARSRDPDSPLPVAAHRLSTLDLPPDWGRSLLLRFASPEYVAPGRLRYRYRLEGFDPDWIEVDAARRLASYGSLPPGRFLLRLQAIDGAGRGSAETRIALAVAPHWWQTLPARLGGLALMGLLLAGLYLLRVRHLHHQQQALEAKVEERTQALSNARQHAEAALRNLQATQDELVRAEKLAALGQLVAGVAHEVNTPLGVAVTASSHLGSEVGTLRARLEEGKLGRRELQAFLDGTAEGIALIERNLQRAVELVRSFKQVSVDRSADGRREFALDGFLAELTQSLRLLWKHRPVSLQIDCPPDLVLDSFPGTLGQVLTNLAQNALLHAFAEDQRGLMRIVVREAEDGRIAIDFSDDGRGIAAADLPRVFEPFFTTRRNSGGTGLGLHIVHNLVTQKLGGSLSLDSQPGVGTTVRLRLPRCAP
jgi:signal transduction histidine kinase